VVALVARMALSHRAVNYVATLPGPHGMVIAFVAELVIAFILMTVVLNVSNTPHLARYTGIFAGCLVATYITFEGPLSGMSMNPARTFAPAFVGHLWTGLWIYFTAPVLAMQLAALVYARTKRPVYCAKYHHHNNQRCIFNCRFPELLAREAVAGSTNRGTTQPGSPPPATTTRNEKAISHSGARCRAQPECCARYYFRRICWDDGERHEPLGGVLFGAHISENLGRRSCRRAVRTSGRRFWRADADRAHATWE